MLRVLLLIGSFVWLQAFGAIAIPFDEPPAFCDKDRLPVKDALSWSRLWSELGLDRTANETGRLPEAQVPPIAQALIHKYSALHPDQLQKPEVVSFLRALKSVSEGAVKLSDADWKTDANTESGDTFILLASEKIRVACRPAVDPEEYLADMARLMPVFMKLKNIQSAEAPEWLNFAVAERERQAGNLLRNGLSMTHWEMKLNERFISDDDTRRGLRQQWILLRQWSEGMHHRACFIGTGTLELPMLTNLTRAGLTVTAYDAVPADASRRHHGALKNLAFGFRLESAARRGLARAASWRNVQHTDHKNGPEVPCRFQHPVSSPPPAPPCAHLPRPSPMRTNWRT